MNYQKIMKNTMQSLLDKGADKVSIELEAASTEEFNVIFKELNLLRSLESQSLSIMVLKDNKQASTNLNQLDSKSLEKATDQLISSVETATEDPAFDISPFQQPLIVEKGPQKIDSDGICYRLNRLTEKMEKSYPTVHYDAIVSYINNKSIYMNSNQTIFEETKGYYSFTMMFSAKEGDKMSSLNYTGFNIADLDRDLLDINFTEELVKQITEQTQTQSIPESFSGDIILLPYVAGELLSSFLSAHLGNAGILFKSSRFPDHLGKKILDKKLTVHTRPLDDDLPSASMILPDGFLAKDETLIDSGVLKHYTISLYAANKTGMKRTVGPCDSLIIEPGVEKINDIIKKVKKGILCARLSYGSPNANGDISGVLKNSYYVEDGKIMYPVSETMMNGNLVDMFNNIEDISGEYVNTGDMKLPYFRIKDVYFSKK